MNSSFPGKKKSRGATMQLVATKIVCQQKTPDFFGDSKVFISHATMTNVIFVTPARTLSISGLKS